jgi:hypothetical protein
MISSATLLTTAAVAVLSAERITPTMASITPNFADYIYEPKLTDPEFVEGEYQNPINTDVFPLERRGRRLQQPGHQKNLPKRERYLAHHGGGYYSRYD